MRYRLAVTLKQTRCSCEIPKGKAQQLHKNSLCLSQAHRITPQDSSEIHGIKLDVDMPHHAAAHKIKQLTPASLNDTDRNCVTKMTVIKGTSPVIANITKTKLGRHSAVTLTGKLRPHWQVSNHSGKRAAITRTHIHTRWRTSCDHHG